MNFDDHAIRKLVDLPLRVLRVLRGCSLSVALLSFRCDVLFPLRCVALDASSGE